MLISDKFQFKKYSNLPLNNSMNLKNTNLPSLGSRNTSRNTGDKGTADFKFQKAGAEQLIRSPRHMSSRKNQVIVAHRNVDQIKGNSGYSPPRHNNIQVAGFGHQKFNAFGGARIVDH
jgi:hypothetical protein